MVTGKVMGVPGSESEKKTGNLGWARRKLAKAVRDDRKARVEEGQTGNKEQVVVRGEDDKGGTEIVKTTMALMGKLGRMFRGHVI